ncbi:MAG: MBL fold metallo-hydrolase [Deltaproteobacteria bacterium]|nr:MBL fold metallo-hydrolase [Deltaproteobacteria bacterium]
MRFSVLASGSKGNACYVETENTRLLIDAGLSCRDLIYRMESVGLEASRLDAIIITHEHSDHVKGAGPISRKFNSTVYSNSSTIKRCKRAIGNTCINDRLRTGESIIINDITIQTFAKDHDAVDPIGLIVCSNGSRLGILTDVGESTSLMEDALLGCTGILLEFNHDIEMLDNGPYPYYLKKRIKGSKGHLSNEQAGLLLKRLSHKSLKHIVLAHLSEVNNTPEKALAKALESLSECNMENIQVHVSYQDCPCPMLEV